MTEETNNIAAVVNDSDGSESSAKSNPPGFTKITGTRKFLLACFGSVLSVVLCFHGNLSGSQWIEIQSLILGLYGCANVIDKKLGGAG